MAMHTDTSWTRPLDDSRGGAYINGAGRQARNLGRRGARSSTGTQRIGEFRDQAFQRPDPFLGIAFPLLAQLRDVDGAGDWAGDMRQRVAFVLAEHASARARPEQQP